MVSQYEGIYKDQPLPAEVPLAFLEELHNLEVPCAARQQVLIDWVRQGVPLPAEGPYSYNQTGPPFLVFDQTKAAGPDMTGRFDQLDRHLRKAAASGGMSRTVSERHLIATDLRVTSRTLLSQMELAIRTKQQAAAARQYVGCRDDFLALRLGVAKTRLFFAAAALCVDLGILRPVVCATRYAIDFLSEPHTLPGISS